MCSGVQLAATLHWPGSTDLKAEAWKMLRKLWLKLSNQLSESPASSSALSCACFFACEFFLGSCTSWKRLSDYPLSNLLSLDKAEDSIHYIITGMGTCCTPWGLGTCPLQGRSHVTARTQSPDPATSERQQIEHWPNTIQHSHTLSYSVPLGETRDLYI